MHKQKRVELLVILLIEHYGLRPLDAERLLVMIDDLAPEVKGSLIDVH